MYNEDKNDKIFLNDLPHDVKRNFEQQIYYNLKRKELYLLRYGIMQKISNVKSIYYYDDDFYVRSKDFIIIIWNDILTWNVIKRR